MTTDEFRRLALSFRGSVEGAHQGHPDFRVHGKIFATLGSPDAGWAMVKLTAAQQARFIAAHPECFRCAAGAWGRRGATNVNLFAAIPTLTRRSLALAHRNIAAIHGPSPRPAPKSAHKPAEKQRAS